AARLRARSLRRAGGALRGRRTGRGAGGRLEGAGPAAHGGGPPAAEGAAVAGVAHPGGPPPGLLEGSLSARSTASAARPFRRQGPLGELAVVVRELEAALGVAADDVGGVVPDVGDDLVALRLDRGPLLGLVGADLLEEVRQA